MNDHPVSDDQLLAYAFDELDAWTALAVATHIARCTVCAATLARFDLVRTAVRADAELVPSVSAVARVKGLIAGRARPVLERPSPLGSLKQLVASLTFDGRSALALGGLRGATTGYVLRYALAELDIDLEIEPESGSAGERWQVTGQISTPEPTGALALAFAEPGSRTPIVEIETGDDGMFFAELPSGAYDVLVWLADGLVVVPNLEVG